MGVGGLPMTRRTTCPQCGSRLPEQRGAGRRRENCCRDCTKIAHHWRELDLLLMGGMARKGNEVLIVVGARERMTVKMMHIWRDKLQTLRNRIAPRDEKGRFLRRVKR